GPRPEGDLRVDEVRRHHDQLPPEGGPPPPQVHAGPRLGPDGLPLPPRSKRPRKPIGPDASGLGPDGKPWDPERRAKRQAEREATPTTPGEPVNTPPAAPVEAQTPSADSSPDHE